MAAVQLDERAESFNATNPCLDNAALFGHLRESNATILILSAMHR